ncbi:ABC transporter pmr5 [Lasiodiplodia theobromae]|uniref:ABC transporter pmr5 n=1 Tax=Lasiodiplodia theobromae TaxID=45133 RepID=UPI0015C35B2B|nr:ABC transporter pmr5 [Lasiodiplodia theobromae]KAF4546554.1 ABC transporter pmr5 [Lasiodiplodia theobromae]
MPSEKSAEHGTQQATLPIYRRKGRSLGIAFDHVSVHGLDASRSTVLDLPELFYRTAQAPIALLRGLAGNRRRPTRRILHEVSGVVFPGETLLVLGRPGSGCSTTLRVLGNNREPFADVEGEVRYASIDADVVAQRYGAEVVYCGEDDLHYPNLAVGHTARFGLHLRGGKHQENSGEEEEHGKTGFVESMAEKLLHSLGIGHTAGTIVGDSFVRGVSGGERRRVSLAEVLASNPAVACWDNPIRGLDSSAALKFLRMLKDLSRTTGMANVATLYQASESMYAECFDRVMVLYEGRMIFSGRAEDAKQYFVDLGFFCHSRQTIAEFLTAVTSPVERVVREDHQGPVPLDPDSMAKAFRESTHYEKLKAEMAVYDSSISSDPSYVKAFIEEHARLRAKGAIPGARQAATIWHQTLHVTRRHFHLVWNDRQSYLIALFLALVTAVVNGSAFYMSPKTSTGSFMKGGGIFFVLIYFFLAAMPHVTSTVSSRHILAKQHRLGFLHPAAYVLGQTLGDIPLAVTEVLVFSLPYYFMLGLTPGAGAFFTFFLIVAAFYCTVLALFRALGAWAPNGSTAMLAAGAAIPVCLLYSGYAPPPPTQLRWGAWLRRVSPSPFALEALLANEFGRIALGCTAEQLVPSGPGYGGGGDGSRYQGCPLPGMQKGETTVGGEAYLRAYFAFEKDHLWRNFGIVVAMWAIYVVLAAVGLAATVRLAGKEGGVEFKRGAKTSSSDGDEKPVPRGDDGAEFDMEKHAGKAGGTATPQKLQQSESPSISSRGSPPDSECGKDESSSDDDEQQGGDSSGVASSAATFTFKDVTYTINVNGKEKRLLNSVSGFVKPGQLTALMGASGAGKTTLLDTLAQRKTEGTVEGEVLLNGRPLTGAFGRSCGFCMQQDVHEPHTTVREALQFSAIMRQPAEVPESEKLAYVENIIELLELSPIADAIIGKPGEAGLGVEERKRVTIGVELAARPSALLFLDEPTSGLDSQAAFSIVRFLQKIAAQGIPVLCTIHQPSGILFDMFDHVLLLAPGGKTLYFGETGRDCRTVVNYFARYGAVMGDNENPAEFILNTATSNQDPEKDWARTWSESPEAQSLQAKIAELKSTSWKAEDDDANSNAALHRAFALPLKDQIIKLTKRHWVCVWRDGLYNFSKLFKCLFVELFIAFSFFHSPSSLQGTQNRVIFFLIFSWLVPAIMPDIQASWFDALTLYRAREKNGIYSQPALIASLVLVELPWQSFSLSLVFLCVYWTLGYPATAAQTGYEFLFFVLYGVFGTGFAQCIAALFPSERLAGYANSLSWVVLTAFTGAAIPHALFNEFYRPWMFWADPLRYLIGGSAANVLHGTEVRCVEGDLTRFDPPPGQTCGAYMEPYLRRSPGYLANPEARADCAYCGYATGDEYAVSLDFYWDKRWRDLGIFVVFCVSNIVIVFAVPWLREKGLRGLWRRK